ncbi:MAG TPA: LacI family DNA-binding transcriptional regulator [Propionibacteriaceae bacterium]|nr:LacI family DNA-binding transcriptional regulator [Propionibacteriaceae bacterium]
MTDDHPHRSHPRTAVRGVRAGARVPVLADVARLAGVSSQTVSRVVNGAPHISPQTRGRVEQAIERLGYRPNSAARALVRGRTGLVGVIATSATYFGPTSILRTIEDAARAEHLFVTSVNLPNLTREQLDESVEHFMRLLVEGIVIIAGQDEAVEVARHRRANVPLVLVEGDLSRSAWSVGVDQAAGALLATEHLLDLGHREILHLAGPLDWSEARARRDGWRAAMVAAGLRPLEPIPGDWSLARGYAARDEVLASGATAVFAANDQLALGLLCALSETGRSAPADLSVVGFDDQPEAAYAIPPLTTIRQDFASVGRRAVETLRRAIAGQPGQPQSLVQPELVVRASTAGPRS